MAYSSKVKPNNPTFCMAA